MVGIINLPLFLITSLIIIIAPGPDFIYVTTRGVSQGKKFGALSALGISAGLLIHTMLAAFGLSAIIQASRIAYLAIQYIGAGYLIYLGLKTFMTNNTLMSGDVKSQSKKSAFRQGVLTNLFNPKAIVTFMAFLPQFVDSKINHPISQFLFLGCILSFIAILWFGVVGYFAGLIGTCIKKSIVFQNVIKYLSGSILILLGIRLAIRED
jgi:threonine/homoserine/homoserine lactone efflux protein